MSLKHILYNVGRRTAFAALTGCALMAASCSDDLKYNGSDDERQTGTGETYGPFEIVIPVEAELVDQRSRATFSNDDAVVNSLWVGIFDITSHRIIASEFYEGENGGPVWEGTISHNTSIVPDVNGSLGVKISNLYFNDDNNKVYIVGVANYDNIECNYTVTTYLDEMEDYEDADGNIHQRPNGETIMTVTPGSGSLKDALDNIKTWEDYTNIDVNTASVEAAITDANCPLLSGVFSGSHGNNTVDVENKYIVKNNNNSPTEVTLFDMTTKLANLDDPFGTGAKGQIHLRRLVNHINVTVNFGDNVVVIGDPTIDVCNIPNYVFLQEHTTVADASKYNAETWKTVTPASSDKYDDGYFDVEDALTLSASTSKDGFFVGESDKLTQTGKTYKFGYWHYENKHWGLPGVSSYADREARYGTSDVFKSLCASEADNFNNGATYFVINANITDNANGYSGNVRFLIHEGYCCVENGDQSGTSSAPIAVPRDFSTFRNTNYNYTVNINGLKDIYVQATQNGTVTNPGASGDIYDTNPTQTVALSSKGQTLSVVMPAGQPVWAIEVDNAKYGVTLDNLDASSPFYALWQKVAPQSYTGGDYEAVYNLITLNGKPLSEATFTEGEQVELKIAANTSGYDYTLYLCGKSLSADGRSSYSGVFAYMQYAGRIDMPEVSMPGTDKNSHVGANTIITGVTNHTLVWEPIEPFKEGNEIRYQTYMSNKNNLMQLDEKVLITPDNAGDYFIDGKFYYKAKYTTMNGFNDGATVTFAVQAIEWDPVNNKEVARSDMWTSTKTVKKATWSFTSSEWTPIKNAIAANNTTYSGGTNELFVSCGGASITTDSKSGGIKLDGSGTASTKKRVFYFNICAKGTLTVVMDNSGEANRCVVFDVYDSTPRSVSKAQSAEGVHTRNEDASKNPSLTSTWAPQLGSEDGTAYIYTSTGGIIFYTITFTPTD